MQLNLLLINYKNSQQLEDSIMSFESFLSDVISSILSGVLLTLIFFIFKEKLFAYPQIEGIWYFQMHTHKTDYNPYKDMKLTYLAIIFREGDKVFGTIEKIHENSSTQNVALTGKNRIRGELQGYLERIVLKRQHKLSIHIVENGKSRYSSHYFTLSNVNSVTMSGTFFSTIANQQGAIEWQREPFAQTS